MNIKHIPGTTPLRTTDVASPAPVATSAKRSVAAAGTAISDSSAMVSVSKVAQMKALIESGQFKVNPEVMADKILASGDLS